MKKQKSTDKSDFVLAMVHWQLSDKTKARACFDHGSEWLKGYEQRCEERRRQGVTTWPLPSLLKRFQAEAAALLQVEPPAESAQPVPPEKPQTPEKEAATEKAKTG